MNFNCQNENTLILSTDNLLIQIYMKDVIYIEGDSYLSIFHFYNSQQTLTFSIILKDIEQLLSTFHFYRINQQILLNLRYLRKIDKRKRKVVLQNDCDFSISYRRLAIFRKFISNKNDTNH